ncbi:hypothetical protein HHK36_018286 [Tetracentron sinense]|uniref:Uncharacterized protein n=1 Tax=Tetracentron sinense TaxID=13715 RepID=A0A835DB46_TETSI|nr:hypothetical protein HHK36_018286 [Tetracentron sinense]
MKTISGKVVSSKPISLSKAASVLSTFVSAETGASQAVSAYLRRASFSFTELVQFHRELKSGRSERKQRKIRLEDVDNGNPTDAVENPREDGGRILDSEEDQSYVHYGTSKGGNFDDEGRDIGRKKKKKKKKKREINDNRAEERESGGGVGIEVEKGKERKKRKYVEVEDGVID